MNELKNLDICEKTKTAERCYENKEYDKAFALCKEAEKNNAPRAYYLLGVMCLLGRGVSKDRQTAMSYFEKVQVMADKNNPIAQKSLGDMYRYGYGANRDYKEAVKWWRKAAEQGYIGIQFDLGWMYYCGAGVSQSYQEAIKWFHKASDQGDVLAQYKLGGIYKARYAVEQNYQEAFKHYQRAAKQGDVSAQFYVGGMYYKGEGVEQSYQNACEYYHKAAAYAYFLLAEDPYYPYPEELEIIYEDADVTEEDYRKELSLAEQGDEYSQYKVAVMYYKGYGIKQDYQEACRRYRELIMKESDFSELNV